MEAHSDHEYGYLWHILLSKCEEDVMGMISCLVNGVFKQKMDSNHVSPMWALSSWLENYTISDVKIT